MPQQFQRPEPPNKVNAFMEKAGWPIITLTIGTVLAAIIIAVWIGKIQVLNFDWLMLLFVLILLAITFFFRGGKECVGEQCDRLREGSVKLKQGEK